MVYWQWELISERHPELSLSIYYWEYCTGFPHDRSVLFGEYGQHISVKYIPWGDELFWYLGQYPAAIENRWSTKLCSLSVLKQLFFFFFVGIHVRLGSKCRVKRSMSYWGDTAVDCNSFRLCWANSSSQWIGESYQIFRSRYALCSNEA